MNYDQKRVENLIAKVTFNILIVLACFTVAPIATAAEGSRLITGEGFGTSKPQACERAIAAAKATAIGAIVLSTNCECEKQNDSNSNCRAEVRIKD